MSDNQFHSFPFHSFLKENKLGTGGMNQRFISTPTLSLVLGMHRNRWEPVGTGDYSQRQAVCFSIYLSAHEIETKCILITLAASLLINTDGSKLSHPSTCRQWQRAGCFENIVIAGIICLFFK
jgi:hypothetical protein